MLRLTLVGGMPKAAAFMAKHGHSINAQGRRDGSTPLFLAAERGYEEVVLNLVTAGALLNEPNNDGVSPLYIASLKGYDDIVNILHSAGATVYSFMLEDTLPDGRTLLYIGAYRGDMHLVKCLLDADVDTEVPTKDGTTALHAAARRGHETILQSLLDAGADVHKVTDNGDTPLTLAALNGHSKCVQALLSSGAQENVEWRSKFNLRVVDSRNQAKLPPFKQRSEPTFMW
jgi:ankyrin repeat protein